MENSATGTWDKMRRLGGLPIGSFLKDNYATGKHAVALSVQVHRDLQQLDAGVAAFWKRKQWHPYGDIDLVTREHRDRMEQGEPYLLAIRDQEEIISCVIGKIMKVPLKLQFGYKVAAGPALTTLVVHRSGFIGRWQHPLYALVLKHWREVLASGVADAVQLRAIPLDSPLHAIAHKAVPFLRRSHFEVVQEYWLLTQIHSFEDFLESRRTVKRNYKYCANRLNRLFSDKMEITCYCNLAEMGLMLEHSEAVSRQTWQRTLGGLSILDDKYRSRYEFYFSKGWCRGYIFYIEKTPVAFLHGIIYKGVFYAENMGYDPTYGNLGFGTYLLLHVIKELCRDMSVDTLDFNVGNSEAKRPYCNSSFKVSEILLFAPGMRLWPVIFLHLMAQGSHELAKSISHRWGFYGSLRNRWRHNR